MSKITLSAILTCLRLVASLTMKCIRLLYAVVDLVDDGCINSSAPRPDWMTSLISVISSFETLTGHISAIEDDAYQQSNGAK